MTSDMRKANLLFVQVTAAPDILLSAQVPFVLFQCRNLPDYGIHILCFLQFEWFLNHFIHSLLLLSKDGFALQAVWFDSSQF